MVFDSRGSRGALRALVPLVMALIASRAAEAQYGGLVSGTGAINRSMAGTATAAPTSAAGALYWNPATMMGLPQSEFEANVELLLPHVSNTSFIPANALGPGVPPIDLSGTRDSESNVFGLPSIGYVCLPPGSRFGFGLGIFTVAGFGVDYPGSTLAPPLVGPPPPNGFGFGPLFSQFQTLQISPSLAYQVTDRFSISAGPTIDIAMLQADPGVFATPNANGTYPTATHGQTTWGGGFVLGAYYQGDVWSTGVSYKSPQWFDTFDYNSANELGQPRHLTFNLSLPQIVSVGTAYTGIDRWLFAVDARYIDYSNTQGFGDSGFAATGALRGTGWNSIFAVSTGVQYQATDRLSLRMGYSWSQNPVPDRQSIENTLSPVIIQNMVTAGASWSVTPDCLVSVAYWHAFENSVKGPYQTPGVTIPGFVQNTASADSFIIGATIRFGAPRHTMPSGGSGAL